MNDTRGMLEGHFHFDPEDAIYADHFPDHPVVPGTLIVHAFLAAVKGVAWRSSPSAIQNFRFKRFIPPGRYLYRIQETRGSAGNVTCQLYDGKDIVATGRFIG